MISLRKLLSWKKQGKDITIVKTGFPDGRTFYKITAIHFFKKTIDLSSNNKELAEKICINIKSISMTIENENPDEIDKIIIWI
jgi:ABC-type molybdate transport system ATPase subunit